MDTVFQKNSPSNWPVVFDKMVVEWLDVTPPEEEPVERPRTIENWWRVHSEMVKDYKSLCVERKWHVAPIDLLHIIGREEKENRHNDMLAWLLDPSAPHGLEVEFITRFFKEVFGEDVASEHDYLQATVEREVVSENTREDIVVWLPESTVVIETKVGSLESERQCEKIFNTFTKNQHIKNPRFIFLTPNGTKCDSEVQEVVDSFSKVKFSQVISTLEVAVEKKFPRTLNHNDIGAMTVLNYLATLREVFQ